MANEGRARLNIYVSRQLWRQVKLAAAARDLSVSEFCASAIEAGLAEVGAGSGKPAEAHSGPRETAVDEARRFKAAHFGKSVFSVSTAELLRASREERGDR
jgi:hypothetical protein